MMVFDFLAYIFGFFPISKSEDGQRQICNYKKKLLQYLVTSQFNLGILGLNKNQKKKTFLISPIT
jgi:hypothetical protein